MKTSITFSLSALEDLENLKAYYEREGAAEAGANLIAGIVNSIERLEDYPLSGRMVPEFMVEHLREIIFSPFRIVYRCEKKRVRIVRVWRSERLLKLP
ncbi:MAG: type II toxin-antitoxin system RelE/ParE family toxin [Nitrospirota bacterium]|nr:type II toxin-antitoxin system RelE/ParE family toxin [Nitrospirota bacterium]